MAGLGWLGGARCARTAEQVWLSRTGWAELVQEMSEIRFMNSVKSIGDFKFLSRQIFLEINDSTSIFLTHALSCAEPLLSKRVVETPEERLTERFLTS